MVRVTVVGVSTVTGAVTVGASVGASVGGVVIGRVTGVVRRVVSRGSVVGGAWVLGTVVVFVLLPRLLAKRAMTTASTARARMMPMSQASAVRRR